MGHRRHAADRADELGVRQATLLAEDALGLTIADDRANATLAWRCFPSEPPEPRCRPTWRVQRHGDTRTLDHDALPEIDTAFLDARSGEVVHLTSSARGYTGHVSQNTNYAGDTGDVQRDMRYAEMYQWYWGNWYANTNSFGNYNWNAPGGSTASIGLHSRGQSLMELHHVASPASCSPVLAYDWQTINLSTGANINIAPNAVTVRRTDWMMFHWLNYALDMYWDFSNVEELPSVLYFDAGTGGGVTFQPCNGDTQTGYIAVGAANDSVANTPGARDVFWEEIHHATEWCIQTVGAGCEYTAEGPRGLISGWGHAQGGAIGSYVKDYEINGRGMWSTNHLRYAGTAVPGDLFLHDSEIEGAATTGPNGCDWMNGGTYTCASDEACFSAPDIQSMDRPRCMKRASTIAQCLTFFPNQHPDLLDLQPYGRAPATGTTPIPICVSNDYANGRIWMHLGEHLMGSAGYLAGVGAFHRANRALTYTRQLTQGADNFHVAMAPWSGSYEASNAFHSLSTETFPWLDDTTNVWSRSEVIRLPRNATLTFTQGGPTGATLAFNQGLYAPGAVFDVDSFLLMLDPNETYQVAASTSSSDVDLCVRMWNHLTGASIAQLPTHPNGCTDGVGARNHTFRFQNGTAILVDFEVRNQLSRAGTYQLQISNVTDDYADALAHNFTSHPLRTGAAVSGSLNSTSDKDLFHYYAPPGTSGTLTITTTGAATSALVAIYASTPPSIPSGSPVATGWGGASTSMTGGQMYYVLLDGLGSTGSYTLTATHAGCGTCNPNGTFAAPLPLPHPSGGIVTNRLDWSAVRPGYDTWAQCTNGTACDWYRIDLQTNERLTVTTFNVANSLCDVELSIFSDAAQVYWQDGAAPPGNNRVPMTWDLNGSMELYGSQLTFQAPVTGTYRIRLRGIHPGQASCSRYDMAVTRGVADMGPPGIH